MAKASDKSTVSWRWVVGISMSIIGALLLFITSFATSQIKENTDDIHLHQESIRELQVRYEYIHTFTEDQKAWNAKADNKLDAILEKL